MGDPTQELVVGCCPECGMAYTQLRAEIQALETRLEALRLEARKAVRALRYGMAWQAADDLEAALQPTETEGNDALQ